MKEIKFTYNEKDYTLCYTRESVSRMEREGFNAQKLDSMPITMIPKMIMGAFYAKHSGIKKTEFDAIFNSLTNKDKLVGKLSEMFMETFNALLEEPTEKNAIKWDASF